MDTFSFNIGTWNSYDVLIGADRNIRRNYVFNYTSDIFMNQDILCIQEAHSPNAVQEFALQYSDTFDYAEYYFPNYITTPCNSNIYYEITNSSGLLYTCVDGCKDSLFSSNGASFIFCVYISCFSGLKDPINGVTTRAINPDLYDIGKELARIIGMLVMSMGISNNE